MSEYYETNTSDIRIRIAEEKDCALILELIKGLAEYEKMEGEVVATEEMLRETIFEKKRAEVVIAEYKGEPVGYALFFYTVSTFCGKANIYLEDLFVRPEARGAGAGKALLACLARIATERGCDRLEWWCLKWNEPSIRFYKQMGARPMDEWAIYRVDGEALPALAERL